VAGRKIIPAVSVVAVADMQGIRPEVLKVFYARNVFEAGYCNDGSRATACTWPEMIGPDNRRQVKKFFISDASNDLDEDFPEVLAALSA